MKTLSGKSLRLLFIYNELVIKLGLHYFFWAYVPCYVPNLGGMANFYMRLTPVALEALFMQVLVAS
jgi:hypothetical protein